jgi:DMSO reductase anchor subunit
MHPAFSVIFFTTASGAGYGLFALLGIGNALGLVPADRVFGLCSLGLATALITAGLFSSTAHLGHPERAWRALSQWRSSWLSREGIAALATYVPLAVFGIGWAILGNVDGLVALAGLLGAVLAGATVYATAMIYRSLKPIHQWHNRYVVPGYLAMALASGAALLNAFVQIWGHPQLAVGVVSAVAIVVALFAKQRYWHFIDTTKSASTPETATGLGAIGKVRLFEAPHTEENYLLKEMGYKIARKHAAKLRAIALNAGFRIPLALTLLATALPGTLAIAASSVAAVLLLAGLAVERGLFFAEAKHSVMLYDGAQTA